MGTTSADSAIANHYNQEYTYQVWGLIAPFLFLVGVVHYGSVALGMLFPGKKKPSDVEADGRVAQHRALIKRLPLAIVNTYRVLAFRTTFAIGPFSLNLSEVALTIAYIVALFVWSFINSTWFCFHLIHQLMTSHSHVSQWNEVCTTILYEPRGIHCLRSTPTRCRPWYQEQHRWM
jgi:hypothetical protein